MTTTEKRLSIAATALALLVAVLFAMGGIFGTSARAFVPDEECDWQPDTIYYFYDFYPTVTEERLQDEFIGMKIIYDRQQIDEQEFAKMVDDGYFWSMDYRPHVVVIDIKTFIADTDSLDYLFTILREYGCKTVFVTAHDYDTFDEEGNEYDVIFKDFIDIYIEDLNMERLRNFVDNAFQKFGKKNGITCEATYILDGNLVDAENFFASDVNTLCAEFPFLKVFLDQLIYRVEYPALNNNEYESYNAIAEELRDRYQVRIFVHVKDIYFVDILDRELVGFYNINDLMDNAVHSHVVGAFGFWRFNQDYYDYLYNSQNEQGYDLPVYAFEVDPIEYSLDGLSIKSDKELESEFGGMRHEAADELLTQLALLLGW